MQPDIGRRVDDGLMMGQMGAHAYGTEREITSRGLRKIQGEFCAPIDSPVGGRRINELYYASVDTTPRVQKTLGLIYPNLKSQLGDRHYMLLRRSAEGSPPGL